MSKSLNTRVFLVALAATWLMASSGVALAQSEQAEKVRDAANVLREIMEVPDQAIPDAVLRRAEAIAVFPSTLKGGFLIGAQRGHGIISVRDTKTGAWSLPGFLTVTGGSFGAQIGVQSVDLVLVVMNRRGIENLLKNQFKIGAGASVTAGPVGRSTEAATDLQLRAEILSYSRARGLFAGVSLQGAAVRPDRDANEGFYGEPYRTRSIVLDQHAPSVPPHQAVIDTWRAALRLYTSAQPATNR
ncbi:MAG: lipid-binding SYLF domain-containing protein [Acidobacteriota bacterium]